MRLRSAIAYISAAAIIAALVSTVVLFTDGAVGSDGSVPLSAPGARGR